MGKISLVEGLVFKNQEVQYCEKFAVVLACNGESDYLICCKCGRGWKEPCKQRKKNRPQEV